MGSWKEKAKYNWSQTKGKFDNTILSLKLHLSTERPTRWRSSSRWWVHSCCKTQGNRLTSYPSFHCEFTHGAKHCHNFRASYSRVRFFYSEVPFHSATSNLSNSFHTAAFCTQDAELWMKQRKPERYVLLQTPASLSPLEAGLKGTPGSQTPHHALQVFTC